MFCHLHCSPQQSQFVTPTKCDDDKAMLEADATITKEQANKLFDACKVRYLIRWIIWPLCHNLV